MVESTRGARTGAKSNLTFVREQRPVIGFLFRTIGHHQEWLKKLIPNNMFIAEKPLYMNSTTGEYVGILGFMMPSTSEEFVPCTRSFVHLQALDALRVLLS
jgi:hypothetical protein